jgi:hypothetical protein
MLVRLEGGLGNQMFQYAFGRSVSKARKEELFFYTSGLGVGCHRAYGLGVFNTKVTFTKDIRGPVYAEPIFTYDKNVYTLPNGTHFIGCWQTEKYFDERLVRSELSLRNPVSEQSQEIAHEILASPNSAFMHVRRTDYLIPTVAAYHGNMTMEYYKVALAYIQERKENVKFFIFSDDPEWCEQNFQGLRVIKHNRMGSGDTGQGTEHEDLFLMGLCKHAILPNSSFGWWGAWFGECSPEGRIVIAPKKWFAGCTKDPSDIVPQRWIKL